MHHITPSAELRLHLVPAGCRLDFARIPGRFAYVYRRQHHRAWECIAHNACSPHLDRTPPSSANLEYVVCYCDAAGNITDATQVAQTQVHSAVLPATPALLSLR